MLTAGSGQALYGLVTVGEVRHDGHDVVATHIEEDGVPPPFSDRHADVIVSAYPREPPPYDETLPSSERRRIRTLVLDEYGAALRVSDPRHEMPVEFHERHDR